MIKKQVTRILIYLSLSVSAFGGFLYPDKVSTDGGELNENTSIGTVINEHVKEGTQTLNGNKKNKKVSYASVNNVPFPVTIILDFDIAQDLDAFYLWNITHPKVDDMSMGGVKNFTLSFYNAASATGSMVGSIFTGAAVAQLVGSLDPTIDSQAFDFASTYKGVRSVKFTILDNQDLTVKQWVGLRELGFSGTKSSATSTAPLPDIETPATPEMPDTPETPDTIGFIL